MVGELGDGAGGTGESLLQCCLGEASEVGLIYVLETQGGFQTVGRVPASGPQVGPSLSLACDEVADT